MLNFFRETKAYTSIFLCLVLMPMVTYATMIIDAVRLQSARVQVQSAGDLAMNATLSEYEQVLQDMYGLFANATSADEIKPAIRNYFEETITGALNYPTDEDGKQYVKEFVEQLTTWTMDGTTIDENDLTNFLAMQLATDDDENKLFDVSPVKSSAISNPNIMRGQIIDYMKYKGPVSIASNFLSKIGFLKDMEAQSNAVQEKITLTQDIAELGEPMGDAYTAIEAYNKEVDNFNNYYKNDSGSYSARKVVNIVLDMNGKLDSMSRLYLCYQYIQKLRNQYMSGDYVNNVNLPVDMSWKSDEDLNHVLDEANMDSETLENATAQLDKFELLINQIVYLDSGTFTKEADQFSPFEEKYGFISYSFGDDWLINSLDFLRVDAGDTFKYYANYGNLSKWNAILSNIDVMDEKTVYANYNAAFELQLELISNITDIAEYQAYYNYFIDLANLYFRKYEEYKKIYANKNPDISDEDRDADPNYIKYAKINNLLVAIQNRWTSTDTYKEYSKLISLLSSSEYSWAANEYREQADDEFVAYYQVIKKLESYSNTAVSELNELISDVETVEGKADDLSSTIDSTVQDDSAKSQMKSDIATLKESVSKEDATQLRDVLKVYHERFKTLKEKMESIHYFNTDRDKLYSPYAGWGNVEYANRSEYDIPLNDAIKNAADLYEQFINKNSSINNTEVICGNFYDANANPDSEKALTKYFQKIAEKIDGAEHDVYNYTNEATEHYNECFYNVLRNTANAKGTSDTDTSDTNKNLQSIEKYTEVNDGEPVKTPRTGNETGTEDESKKDVELEKDQYGDQGNFDEAFGQIKPGSNVNDEKSFGGSAGSVDIPDEDADADSANKSAEQGKNSLAQANNLLSSIANIGNEFKNDVYLEEYFTEMFTCLTDTKLDAGKLKLINSYTNDPKNEKFINPKNDWYGKEMEFILWGNKNLEQNMKKTATTIFLIRFAINAIYAFTASDIQAMANSIATLLVGWTVVLVPVVQVCIVLAVALAESAIDLEELKAGKDVPLIKDKATFKCSPSGAVNAVIEYAVDRTVEYAEEKVTEAIDTLAAKASEGVDACAKEINDVATAYVENVKQSISTAIADNFTTPLVNSVTPALSRLNAEANNAQILLEESLGNAWKIIGDNIKPAEGETNKIKDLTYKLYESVDADTEIKSLAEEIALKVGKDKLPSAGDVQALIDEKINGSEEKGTKGWLGNIQDSINGYLDDARESITSELKEQIENGSTELKSYVNDKIENAGKDLGGAIKDKVKEVGSNNVEIGTKSKSIAAKVTMNYKEYCKLFMFIGLLNNNNEDIMLQRAAVLMQLNVTYAVKGSEDGKVSSAGTSNFRMDSAYTLFYVNANVEIGTLFPWGIEIEDDGTDASANLDLSHLGGNYVRLKYSGLAGY